MNVFIDTGLLVTFHNTRDANHERATELMRQIVEGELGTAYTSDYIFDEAVTVALIRTHNPRNAKAVGSMMLGESNPPFLAILRVSEDDFKEAWSLFSKHAERRLSFTDCTSIALMRKRGIETIVSFDRDFDGIVLRIS